MEELIKACELAVHMLCEWRPDFLEPDEMKAYDDQVASIEEAIRKAKEGGK